MNDIFGAPWFYWALGVAVGLPIVLVFLTELHTALARRRSALAKLVALVRNYVVPIGALLLLLVKVTEISAEATPVRIVATVFGFILLVLLLSGLSTTLFQGAPDGTWRSRMPSIFIDVARFALIAVGLAVIFSYIWGANVGGLFTALGITSIVFGLALQNSVGQIISGLLMLFEQPFQLGDWLDTPSARGRIVEVNWRAVHIDTGSGLHVIPNSVLAVASFTNLSSSATGSHQLAIVTRFSLGDPPVAVCAMLNAVAWGLPQRKHDHPPTSMPLGSNEYRTTIGLRSPADDVAAKALFLRWVWYAARRAGLRLDEKDDDFSTEARVDKALRDVAPILALSATDREQLSSHARVTRYGADEIMQRVGEVPQRMTFILEGKVRLVASTEDGSDVPVATLEEGAFIGQTALTRQAVAAGAYALEDVTVLQLDREHVEELLARKPLLLQQLGRSIEERRESVQRALAAVGE